jgi:hypothetical protein
MFCNTNPNHELEASSSSETTLMLNADFSLAGTDSWFASAHNTTQRYTTQQQLHHIQSNNYKRENKSQKK